MTFSSVVPVSSSSRGVPVTVTFSEKLTRTWSTAPALYAAFASDAETPVTVGAVVSVVLLVTACWLKLAALLAARSRILFVPPV